LFLGRFDEPSSVPLVPFDSEAATVNDYFNKLRRFQELSFEIVKLRNERAAKSRKDKAEQNTSNHSYKIGDYVLIKNLQPGTGPGQVKLRAKYIGPFRIIKVYQTSLAVVPWSLNSKLEQFYRDANLFRIAHRGDTKTFEVRITAIKDVKPYKGPIDTQIIVDPIMLHKFLDQLDLDNERELYSVLRPDKKVSQSHDHDDDSSDSDSSSSDDDGHDGGNTEGSEQGSDNDDVTGGPPQLNDDDSNESIVDLPASTPPPSSSDSFNSARTSAHTEGSNSFSMDNIFQNFEVDPDFSAKIRNFDKLQDQINDINRSLASAKRILNMATGQDPKLRELHQLAMSPDPHIRNKAGNELGERLAYLHDQSIARTLAFSDSGSDSEASEAADPGNPNPQSFLGEVERDRMLANCARRLHNLRDRLSLTGPLDHDIREKVKRSLKKAKSKLKRTKQLAGLSPNSSNSQSEPNSDPSSAKSFSTMASASKSSASNPDEESNQAPQTPVRRGPRPPRRRSDEDQPDNEISFIPPPHLQPFRVTPQPTPRQQPPVAQLPQQKDIVRNWLEDHEQQLIKEQDEPAVFTRSGRRVQKPTIFDPADEVVRERELRQNLKVAEAERKAARTVKVDPPGAAGRDVSPQPGPSRVHFHPSATSTPGARPRGHSGHRPSIVPRDISPQQSTSGIQTRSAKSKATAGISVKSSKNKTQ